MKSAWDTECDGSALFKVVAKIKRCRLELLQWSRQQQGNATKEIQRIKGEMDRMKEEGGQRDWESWNYLRSKLHEAYKRKRPSEVKSQEFNG